MKPVARHLLAVILLLFGSPLCAGSLSAGPPPADSARIVRATDSGAQTVDTLGRAARPGKSPGLAMLYSAILPGAGQVYNQSYWKVPVFLGLGLYFASTWLDQNRRVQEYRQKYEESLYAIPPNPIQSDIYLRQREFYKQQRDTFAWYFLILYAVNIADAYVDASLFNFDVGPDLSLRVLPGSPGQLTPVPGVTLQLKF
ncbi:MAG TPA: DUF5683 domain-containing protein [Bacteroidota bacterium]|nr:DUF5683 domain-containing protein [Bacteroidota bacterium]